ncbi:IMP dehydrogenase/GMP reductase [Desulfurococcaceae archaeon AG1]|nr:IMP dehydrogenase/GMP reductase [Desulfurococcaceae archaeon AG1]
MTRFLEKILSPAYSPDLDELYLLPGKADLEPSQIDISTYFTKNIRLKIPLVSSPMDTVSEWRLAVSIALMGGVGVIHRNMSVEEQVRNLEMVKSFPPIPLEDLYLLEREPCGRAIDAMRKKGVRNMPVIDPTGSLKGYVRYSDLLESCRDGSIPINRFITPGVSFDLPLAREAVKYIARGESDVIAITNGGIYIGSLSVHGAMEPIDPVIDDEGRLLVAAAINPIDIERAKKLDRLADAIVSDVAHYHNSEILRASSKLVKEISSDFVAGNIGTAEAALDAATHIERIDGFRVGVGGGSICITPNVAGVYAPTIWSVASVRDALEAQGLRIPLIADGGLRSASDIVKALAVGASTAMAGYIFAGTDEAPSELIEVGGELYKQYRGMASITSMMRRFSMDRYAKIVKNIPEGVGGLVPYKGSARSVIREVVEGIRIAMGYAGARNIEDLWAKARFIRASKKKTLGGRDG